MAGGREDNRHGAVTNDSSGIGSVTVQQVDEKIETLTKRFNDLLLVVEDGLLNKTGKVSSAVIHSVNQGGKILDDGDKNSSEATVCKRDPKLDVAIIEEFHSSKQEFKSVAVYQKMFEKSREALMTMDYDFNEDYFIYSFLSGLREEIRCILWEQKPKTLDHAFALAHLIEFALHVKQQTLISSGVEITEEDTMEETYDSMDLYCTYDYPQKLHGLAGKRVLSIVCYTGTPCNFLDTKVAIMAGCKMEEAEPLLVNFVHGDYKAVSRFKSRFHWMIQGHEFVADVRIVELGAVDMVLGMKWLCDYHVGFDIAQETAWFVKEGKTFVLQMPFQTTQD